MLLPFYRTATTGVLISPWPGKEGNNLQRQKVMIIIHLIYNHNWRNIITIYIYNKVASKEIFLLSNKIHREVGRAKELSAPPVLYYCTISIFLLSFSSSVSMNLKEEDGMGVGQDVWKGNFNLYIWERPRD
jgi:hypothetical protein